jgi:hypothetical protein
MEKLGLCNKFNNEGRGGLQARSARKNGLDKFFGAKMLAKKVL